MSLRDVTDPESLPSFAWIHFSAPLFPGGWFLNENSAPDSMSPTFSLLLAELISQPADWILAQSVGEGGLLKSLPLWAGRQGAAELNTFSWGFLKRLRSCSPWWEARMRRIFQQADKRGGALKLQHIHVSLLAKICWDCSCDAVAQQQTEAARAPLSASLDVLPELSPQRPQKNHTGLLELKL